MEHCPRTFQRFHLNQPTKKRAVRPKAKKQWDTCPKCKCSVERQNLPGHLRACNGAKPKPSFEKKKKQDNVPVKESKIMSEIAALHEAKRNRILSEIQRIKKEAWLVGDVGENSEARFGLAIQKAMRLIRLLSPHIRREVEHHFSSQKWSSLLR